ncbi:predicted protein [Naegleria gruberi]|uniref:Predicted protein n=1 Tax=Naegleria gruberi TaxID=5762 RepID=D2VXL9_NAEGR|nr:uncharacterized protein NAEGRDRAFT_53056 [Naegleria gruberi]EFC38528.1 predicted protein [Naegleria gruberi]|eukprot:XP_002671272.1 predicted protein [Naegleria gruberi strain NEG-M]
MVADRIIPIKYNSLLGYENDLYQTDDYYYYQPEETQQSFIASTEVIPLGLICHETFKPINSASSKALNNNNIKINNNNNNNTKSKALKRNNSSSSNNVNNKNVNTTMNAKDARKEKRRQLFKSKMMAAHFSFVEENGVELREFEGFKSAMTNAFMLVMIRKDTSGLFHHDSERVEGEYFTQGISQYKIALINMRKFRIVSDLEDFIFLDLEIDGKMKKYLELEGDFSRRNHYMFTFENDVKIENEDNHIVNSGKFTFLSEGMYVQFRLIMDRLEIANTRVLVEKYVKSSPFERESELISGKFTPLNRIFPDRKSTNTLTINENQLVLYDLDTIEKRLFPLPSLLQNSKKLLLSCELPSHKGMFMIANSDVFSIGSNGSAFTLEKDEILSESLTKHLEGLKIGEVCKLTESKYLILLERANNGTNTEEITLLELFENSKWLIMDLSKKTLTETRPTVYKTRSEEMLEDGFTAVSKKRKQQPRHFLTNYGGEINGFTRNELEKLNMPKFTINKRSMYSFRPFRKNQDCFVVKTFLTSSKVDNHAFELMKAEMLPVAHFTNYFHIKEEAISDIRIDRRFFCDLEIKCDIY